MYNNIPLSSLRNEACDMGLCGMSAPMEETIQTIVADILNQAKRCRELSVSIDDGLFGSRPTNEQTETSKSILCLEDALKETRYILGNTIDELEGINRKL
jgi:hypothetical protein